MNKIQSNRLSMFQAVLAVLDSSDEVFTAIPILTRIRTELAGYIEQIKITSKAVSTFTAGRTLAKEDAREILSEILLVMGNSIYAYAKRNNIQDIIAICDISSGRLSRMKENDLVIKAAAIIEKLNSYKEQLANYGVTTEKIGELVKALDDFNTAADVKDKSSANKSAGYDVLDGYFQKVNELLLHELDGIVEHFKISNQEFYKSYFAARVIKDLGGHHTNNDAKKETAEQPAVK